MIRKWKGPSQYELVRKNKLSKVKHLTRSHISASKSLNSFHAAGLLRTRNHSSYKGVRNLQKLCGKVTSHNSCVSTKLQMDYKRSFNTAVIFGIIHLARSQNFQMLVFRKIKRIHQMNEIVLVILLLILNIFHTSFFRKNQNFHFRKNHSFIYGFIYLPRLQNFPKN